MLKNPNVENLTLRLNDNEWKELPEWKKIFYNHIPDPVEKKNDVIDLNAIEIKVEKVQKEKYPGLGLSPSQQRHACMREAIHQALILASEKATIETPNKGRYREAIPIPRINKASILDIEKLIV